MANLWDSAVWNTVQNSITLSPSKRCNTYKAAIRSDSGTLYTAFWTTGAWYSGYTSVCDGYLFQSTDNGWSWSIVAALGGDRYTGQPGPCTSIVIHPTMGLHVFTGYNATSGKIALRALTASATTSFYGYPYFDDWPAYNELMLDGHFCTDGDNLKYTWFSWIDGISGHSAYPRFVNVYWPISSAEYGPFLQLLGSIDEGITFDTKFDMTNEDEYIHWVGVTNSDPQALIYFLVEPAESSYESPVTISTATGAGADIDDPGIDVDGFGNLCTVWTERSSAGIPEYKHAMSFNSGTDWIPEAINPPSGCTPASGDLLCSQVMGTKENGFLLAGIYQDASGIAGAYVKKLESSTGASGSYVLESDWNRVNSRDDHYVSSASFFREKGSTKDYVGNLEDSRMIYIAGQGDSDVGDDFVTSIAWTERLTNNAYENEVETSGNFDSFIDYYSGGYTGTTTTKYADAIETHGTEVSVLKYEPIASATTLGESSFTSPTVEYTKVVLVPTTYDNPSVREGNSGNFKTAIERDVRVAYFKPDFFMGREYVLADSGYIRRTVYTLRFGGREYEVTQIVPHLYQGQICFWKANLYVIGPSNMPFKTVTLPSET